MQALRIKSVLATAIISITVMILLLTLPLLSAAQEIVAKKSMQAPESISITNTITPERQTELVYMVQQDCGACHGMTLKGGLGPNLLPERVSVLPTQYLIDVITNGRQETPMPPWGPLLTQQEIKWIAEQLQLGHLAQKRH